MRQFSVGLFLSLGLFLARAQAFECGPTVLAPLDKRIERPFLFKVTKNARSHFLFGTYHNIFDFENEPKVVHDALVAAKSVALEIEYPEVTKANLRQTFKDFYRARSDYGFSNEAREKLCRMGIYQKLNGDPSPAGGCHGLFIDAHRDYPLYMMDKDIYLRAKTMGKPTFALDAPEIFAVSDILVKSSLPECNPADLLETLSADDLFLSIKKYLDAYRRRADVANGAADTLYRNQAWIPKLEKVFATGETFVAVGAGHLQGAGGLIALLEARGYDVRAVDQP